MAFRQKNLRTIFTESLDISLWTALLLTSWQLLSIMIHLDQYAESVTAWIHFVLYALGGTWIFILIAMIPVVIIAMIRSAISREWEAVSIRRFILTGLLCSILVIIFFAMDVWSPAGLLASGIFSFRILIRLITAIIVTGIFGYILALGLLQVMDSMSTRTQWSVIWGIFIFTISFLPLNNYFLGILSGSLTWLGLVLSLVALLVILLLLPRFLPRIYGWFISKSPSRPIIGLVIALLAFFITMPIKSVAPDGEPVTDNSPPVILITLETLRPDALDCYPEGLALRLGTPNISELADEGTLFEWAYSSSPWTSSSVPSFLSGLPPGALSDKRDGGTYLTDGATTIAEILKDSGYTTCGIAVNSFLAEGSGNEQGFDIYIEEMTHQAENRRLLFQKLIDRIRLRLPEISSPNINPYMERDAIRRARNFFSDHAGEKFFLWLHLYTPHQLYYPPKEYRDRVENELGITVPPYDVIYQEEMKDGWPAGTVDRLEGLLGYYAGDVAFADDLIGELIATLKDIGIYDNSLLIVSSDHGEEFYEHGRLEHSRTLYPEVVHVPLIFRWPGEIPEGVRIDTAVSLVDLAPTILDLIGVGHTLDGNPAEFFGSGFSSHFYGEVIMPRPIFIERPLLFDQNMKGVIYNDILYIGGSDSIMREKLFDLESDPGAFYDIIRERPDDAEFMSGLIVEFEEICDEIAERIGSSGREEDIENLRTLGYIN